jgi:hypothetical protein
MVALALLLHLALVRSGIRPLVAALIAVFVCSMPGFELAVSWTVLFTVPWAALLAGGASLLAVAATGAPRTTSADRLVGATAALLAGLLMYQPAAMFFWVFLAVALVGARHEPGRALRVARTHLGVFSIGLALWYAALRLGIHSVGSDAPGASRSVLTHDVAGTASWFVRKPLYLSLNLFDLTPSHVFAVVVGAVAAGGILLWLFRSTSHPWPYVGLGLLLVPLSYLPRLATGQGWASYRTQVSLDALIALYVSLGVLGLCLTLRERLRPRVSTRTMRRAEGVAVAAMAAFVVVSAFIAARNLTTLIVNPQKTELNILRSQVAALPSGTTRIAFVETDWYGGPTSLVVYDEFGLPSTAQRGSVTPWAPEPMIDLVLREEGRLTTRALRPAVDFYPPYTSSASLPRGEPVIDVQPELRRRR